MLPYICLIGNVCAAPKGMVCAPFWSENGGQRLCLFSSELVFVFAGTEYASESMNVFVVLSPKVIGKKEQYANSKWILRNLFVGVLI